METTSHGEAQIHPNPHHHVGDPRTAGNDPPKIRPDVHPAFKSLNRGIGGDEYPTYSCIGVSTPAVRRTLGATNYENVNGLGQMGTLKQPVSGLVENPITDTYYANGAGQTMTDPSTRVINYMQTGALSNISRTTVWGWFAPHRASFIDVFVGDREGSSTPGNLIL